jgi:hypothetical protein
VRAASCFSHQVFSQVEGLKMRKLWIVAVVGSALSLYMGLASAFPTRTGSLRFGPFPPSTGPSSQPSWHHGFPGTFPTSFPSFCPTTFPTTFPTSRPVEHHHPSTLPTTFPTTFPTTRPDHHKKHHHHHPTTTTTQPVTPVDD